VGVVWFLIPYLNYQAFGKIAKNSANQRIDEKRLTPEEKKALKEKVKTELDEVSFRDLNRELFGVDKNL
jgi:hypothetical protein